MQLPQESTELKVVSLQVGVYEGESSLGNCEAERWTIDRICNFRPPDGSFCSREARESHQKQADSRIAGPRSHVVITSTGGALRESR